MCDVFEVPIPVSQRFASESVKRPGREAVAGAKALEIGNGGNPQAEEGAAEEKKIGNDFDDEKERKDKKVRVKSTLVLGRRWARDCLQFPLHPHHRYSFRQPASLLSLQSFRPLGGRFL